MVAGGATRTMPAWRSARRASAETRDENAASAIVIAPAVSSSCRKPRTSGVLRVGRGARAHFDEAACHEQLLHHADDLGFRARERRPTLRLQLHAHGAVPFAR